MLSGLMWFDPDSLDTLMQQQVCLCENRDIFALMDPSLPSDQTKPRLQCEWPGLLALTSSLWCAQLAATSSLLRLCCNAQDPNRGGMTGSTSTCERDPSNLSVFHSPWLGSTKSDCKRAQIQWAVQSEEVRRNDRAKDSHTCAPQVRHAAMQEDGLSTYGWLRHDGEQFGRQTLVDKDYNISLTMVRKNKGASLGFVA